MKTAKKLHYNKLIINSKKLHYDKLIINSNNKAKSIWYIVKLGGGGSNEAAHPLNIDGTFKVYQSTANNFNTYFTITTDKISVNNSMTMNLALNYLYKVFVRPFPHIPLTSLTTKEISVIIKSL